MSQFPDQNLPQLLFTVNRFCRAIQIVGRSKSYASITELQKKLAIAELEGIEVGDMNAGVDDGKGDISLTHGENPKVLNFLASMRQKHKKRLKDAKHLVTTVAKVFEYEKESGEEYDEFIQLFEELVGIKFPFDDSKDE